MTEPNPETCPTPLRRWFMSKAQARHFMIRNEVDGLAYDCRCGKIHVRKNPR